MRRISQIVRQHSKDYTEGGGKCSEKKEQRNPLGRRGPKHQGNDVKTTMGIENV